MNELLPIENVSATTIFTEGGLDKLLADIHAEAESHVPDITTDKGRKAVASLAAKVAKSKTYLDGLGKEMVAVWKNQAKVVDGERKKMRDDLDELKAKVRKPLTDYEDAEDARINAITYAITEMAAVADDTQTGWLQFTLDEIKQAFKLVRDIYKDTSFDERAVYAAEVFDSAKTKIIGAMDMRENYDKEQAELERLRNEAAKRDREAEKKEHKKKIEDDKKAAAEKAVKDEQDRVAAKREQDEREAKVREADVAHRKMINNQSVDALKAIGLDARDARAVVTAIAKNKIANIVIRY